MTRVLQFGKRHLPGALAGIIGTLTLYSYSIGMKMEAFDRMKDDVQIIPSLQAADHSLKVTDSLLIIQTQKTQVLLDTLIAHTVNQQLEFEKFRIKSQMNQELIMQKLNLKPLR